MIEFMTENDWVLRIVRKEDGPVVEFNVDKYPNCLPNDFAQAFGAILSKSGYLDQFLDDLIKRKNENIPLHT